MNEKAKVTPKDFFFWAGAMVTLYFSIGSFITLSFEYIDRLVGEGGVVGYDPYSSGIRLAIASLIVLFPVFITLTRLLQKDIRVHPEKSDLWVRRWLIVLTIFGAAVALIVDLIVLLNAFLGGEELTAAFLLKILTVLIVFGGVFYYYVQAIRGVWVEKEKLSKMIGAGVSGLLVIFIILGFFIMGSPAAQREFRNDDQRINDLSSIQSQVTNYYRATERLPDTLEDLKDPLVGGYISSDPQTDEDYEYEKTGALTFELCATFERALPEIDETGGQSNDWRIQDLKRTAEDWAHGEGRTCFERTIDPELIKPYPEQGEILRF
ncbi:hypothetical protein JXR01_00955 [Candidatus Kaiserbacteria bacterium]|nr:MAG: hypothetical protein JXR01_00955 [Candidatus Kaiserbacteria bacterium]